MNYQCDNDEKKNKRKIKINRVCERERERKYKKERKDNSLFFYIPFLKDIEFLTMKINFDYLILNYKN